MDMHHRETAGEEEEACGDRCGAKCHGHFKHRGVRVLTAVIVIIFVFWCGFQFGEIRTLAGFRHSGYGSMMMGGWGAQ